MPSASPIPPGHGKLISLEIARFIGIMIVVADHYATTCADYGQGKPMFAPPGPIALTFFFTLSGFVVHTIHHRDAGKPRRILRYFWRRVWRIYPIFILSLPLMIVVLWHGITLPYLLNNLTLNPGTVVTFAELNPPAWSLRYDILYYILFGLALALPYIGRFVLPAWGVLLAWSWYARLQGLTPPTAYMPAFLLGLGQHFFALLDIFILTGVAAAWCFARFQPKPRVLWALLGASVLLLLPLEWQDGWGTQYPLTLHLPLTAALMATVIFSLAALERGGHLRPSPRLEACGILAYPLYLLHSDASFAFGAYFFYHPEAEHYFTAPTLFALMFSIALLLSWAGAYLFDVPLQRLVRRMM